MKTHLFIGLGTGKKAAAGIAVVAAALLSGSPVLAQEPGIGAQVESADPGLASAGVAPADYRVGPGDLLAISVSQIQQLGVSSRVSNSGKLRVPRLGVMKVTDMTTAELEAEISKQLKERELVKDAWVSVRVTQYRARPVYILGEVMMPGQFVIQQDMYLVDLLTLAGGLNEVATPVGFLYRRKPNAGELPNGEAVTEEAIPIDFQALSEGTRPELNLKLRGGDVLYVPERRKKYYYIVGEVNGPGFFELASAAEGTLRLSQAIAKAGGPLRTAKMSAGILVRKNAAGERQELPVDFKAILDGRQPDELIQADDIVFIPGSSVKTLAYGFLGILPNVAASQSVDRIKAPQK